MINSSLSWKHSLLIAVRSSLLSMLSCLASRLPHHCSKVHVCERDSEWSLYSLWLHTLLYSPHAVQVVHSPGIQRSNCFLETLRKRSKRTSNKPSYTGQFIYRYVQIYLNRYSSDSVWLWQRCNQTSQWQNDIVVILTSFSVPVSLQMATTAHMRICRQQVAPMHAPSALPQRGYT